MLSTMGDGYYRQRSAMAGRRVRRESDARRDLERMHLMTIRREKMRLQEELERVRVKGQQRGFNNAGKNAKLLSSRFGMTASSSRQDEDDHKNRRRTRLNTAGAPMPRARSPYSLRQGQSLDRELPQIAAVATPLKGELEMRKQKDEMRDPNTKLNELKKNEGRQKNLLSLKVDMFTRSLTPVSPGTRSPARSPVPMTPPPNIDDRHDVDALTPEYELRMRKHENDLDNRATFPPPTKNKLQRLSAADYDVPDANGAVDQGIARYDDALPMIQTTHMASHAMPRRQSIIRRQSQVAILERNDKKKNKYSVANDAVSNNNNNDSGAPKKSVESELNLAVLGRDAKRVKEIIENPEIVFDQEKYAPDGALRTVHMLPDADSAFSQARQARYLRWRDPNELDKERELTINEIFAKGKGGY